MPKYIEADKLEKEGWSASRTYQQDAHTMVYETKKLTDFPPVNVRENVHAHWIHERLVSTGGGSYPVVRCSACQWQYPMSETRFCPKCGAQMDEEEPTMEEYMYGQEGSEEDGSL